MQVKRYRMNSFIILHQMASEKGVTQEGYELWFLVRYIFLDYSEDSHRQIDTHKAKCLSTLLQVISFIHATRTEFVTIMIDITNSLDT